MQINANIYYNLEYLVYIVDVAIDVSTHTLTAPQCLQWCFRLVKLNVSLQPLHVSFSLSRFFELR